MQHLNYRLANLRDRENMTQAALGRKLGVSRQTIWNYENSKRVPTFKRLLQYSEIFKVSTDYILKGEK